MSILVLGAIHHDVIVEAPRLPMLDETLPGQSVRYAFGGKGGNQALAAARYGTPLGVSVSFAGCVGADQAGKSARRTLIDGDVDAANLQQAEGSPTGMSVAISLPEGGYGAVIVSGANKAFDPEALYMPPGTRWLVIQNELLEPFNIAAATMARQVGAKVVLNAAPARPMSPDLSGLVDYLVVNRVEAAGLLGQEAEALVPTQAVKALAEQAQLGAVITLGGEGVCLADASEEATLHAHTVPVISTHGAGDAFIGALTVQLDGGKSLHEAARFANAAAALHVSTPPEERAAIELNDVDALLA
ncbi:MAG: bifunctional hydroxymethylpyrimidine kinase/phosphomethylpyrimidine kinase [Devosiaceae bacterium]|nr:bifunctional hydroxymethylpyrimidine kinase/phosphomethylpyrimidine kinase [Devosiaceae bacterium MH13]